MRAQRVALFAIWAVVSVLAVAGFAAFNAGDESPADVPDAQTTIVTVPRIGRNAGAVAAMAFSASGNPTDASPVTTIDLDAAVQKIVEERAARSATTTTIRETRRGTPSTPFVRSRYLSEVQVRELVERYFRPEDVNKAIRISWCESSFNPDAIQPVTGATGLFQHLPRYWQERSQAAGFGEADIFDPDANVAVAAWLVYEAGGWSHWTCRG